MARMAAAVQKLAEGLGKDWRADVAGICMHGSAPYSAGEGDRRHRWAVVEA